MFSFKWLSTVHSRPIIHWFQRTTALELVMPWSVKDRLRMFQLARGLRGACCLAVTCHVRRSLAKRHKECCLALAYGNKMIPSQINELSCTHGTILSMPLLFQTFHYAIDLFWHHLFHPFLYNVCVNHRETIYYLVPIRTELVQTNDAIDIKAFVRALSQLGD